MASLIQQRIAIDRRRMIALVGLIGSAVMLVLAVAVVAFEPGSWTAWTIVVTWLAIGVATVRSFVAARRSIREFEAEHGPDAGKQPTI